MLAVLLSNDVAANAKEELLADRYGLKMTEEMKNGVEKLCNLSEVIEEKGAERVATNMLRRCGKNSTMVSLEKLKEIAEDAVLTLDRIKELAMAEGLIITA